MKRIIASILIVLIIALTAGCGIASSERPNIDAVKSYKDIPGVTKEEIAAIEKLKAERGSFSYGSLLDIVSYESAGNADAYKGFSAEICTLLSELFEVEFVQMPYDSWQQLRTDVDGYVTDFTGDLTADFGHSDKYRSTKPIAESTQTIYALAGSKTIMKEADVNGLKLGFLENSVNLWYIQEQYPNLSFDAVTVDYISSVESMLISGEIDGFVTERNLEAFFGSDRFIHYVKLFPLAATPLSMTTANSELSPIISVMNKYLVAGGIEKLYDYYAEDVYTRTRYELFQSFTDEERAYLNDLAANNEKVDAGLQHDAYPVSFYNETDKEFQGVALDILAEITRLTDIEFATITTSTDTPISEILAKLKTGEVSIMTQLLYTESRKNDYIWSRVPYLTTKYALLSKSELPDLDIYQVSYRKVGTVNRTAHEEMFNKWFPDHEYHTVYNTTDEAFDALERGDVDLVMLSENMLLTLTNYREKAGFKINISFDTTLDSLFGFSKKDEVLRSIIDKTFVYINTDRIANTWLNRSFDYDKKISKMQSTYLFILAFFMLMGLVAMTLLALRNIRLGKKLTERTVTLSAIYSSIPDTIFSKDTKGVYTSCNPSFEKQAGMPEAELVGKTYAEVFKERVSETAELYRGIDKKVINGGAMEITEETVTYPDGSQRILETLKAPLIQNGKTVGLLGLGRDVTERKEASERLQRIINTAQIAFMMTIDGIVAQTNEYSAQHIGIKVGDDIRPFYADAEQRDELIRMAGEDGTVSSVIIKYKMVNGEIHRFFSSITSVEYDGKKAYLVWALDVEQDEKKNDQIRVMQQSLQTVLDVLPMPIRIVDIESTEILYVNESFVEFLECESSEDIYKRKIHDFLPDVMSNGTTSVQLEKLIIESETPAPFEVEYRTITGKIIEALIVARHIDYKGRRSSIGIIRDLTVEKEQARILLEAAEREKEANQAKSMFLANMSHEIRTPMNGIIGMTDLLLVESLSERQLQYAKDIKTSAESLLGIINDILDLSKISEGRLQIMPVDTDLSTLLKNTASMMSFTAGAKGLEFISSIRLSSPEYVRVDDIRLKQVIVNLLSNAVKFTKTGYVKLSAEIDGNNIVFEVSDTGTGIRQEDLPLIFMAFEQADIHKNRAIKGTGLGLSISKNLVELMGGKIWVESEYGVGTTFYFTVPYVPGDESAVTTEDTKFEYIFAPAAQILLVDDIQTNLTVGAGLLRLCGVTADIAMSGREAIELVKSNDYDIVFMDHMMPEMDGIEAMQIIRGMGDKYVKLPIIALTANAVNESKTLLLSSGMDDFLSKPIDKAALMSILKKWLPTDKIETGAKSVGTELKPYSDVLAATSKIEGLDVELALSRISGMRDVLETSLRQVANTIDGHIRKMDAHLSDGDLRGFSIEAHGLKGALANIGAMRNSELSAELEIASKAENIPLCEKKFAVFASSMESFASELKAVFSKAETKSKPQGAKDFLSLKTNDAIECLNNFDANDALDCLTELSEFTFGAKTDAVLSDARSSIEAFDYEKATAMLKGIFL